MFLKRMLIGIISFLSEVCDMSRRNSEINPREKFEEGF